MFIKKDARLKVYKYILSEGVCVVHKDRTGVGAHKELGMSNLVVFKLMQSLESREYVKCTFNWQWNYFYLTNEGLEYLREYCHVPDDVVPLTHTSTSTGERPRTERGGDSKFGRGRFGGDKEGASGDYKPSFRGGYGRGAGGREGYRRDNAEAQTETA